MHWLMYEQKGIKILVKSFNTRDILLSYSFGIIMGMVLVSACTLFFCIFNDFFNTENQFKFSNSMIEYDFIEQLCLYFDF